MSMPDSPTQNLLPRLQSRREYFDYLDGWPVGAVDAPRSRRMPRAVTKAFLLETSRTNNGRDAKAALSEVSGVGLDPVDETLFRMRWLGETEDWALLEVKNERYPVIYTEVKSDIANRRIDRLVTEVHCSWTGRGCRHRCSSISGGLWSGHSHANVFPVSSSSTRACINDSKKILLNRTKRTTTSRTTLLRMSDLIRLNAAVLGCRSRSASARCRTPFFLGKSATILWRRLCNYASQRHIGADMTSTSTDASRTAVTRPQHSGKRFTM